MRLSAHTHDNPSDRYLLSHNASLDRTLGGLLLSYNCCCGWFGHRQILHKVGLFTIQTQCQKLHCPCLRFTEEAFAALVGIIFIKESLSKLFSKFHKTLHKNPLVHKSSEMGKTFKVHMDFDLDEITTEEHCGCDAPNDTVLDQLNQMFQ